MNSMLKNTNNVWNYDWFSKFKIFASSALIIWSLHTTLAQTHDSTILENNNIVNTKNWSEKLDIDMANAINIEFSKLNINNFEKIQSNITKAICFAYDIPEDEADNKIFIKRGRVPYTLSIWFADIKKYIENDNIEYSVLKIESHNWKIYLVVSSKFLTEDKLDK